MMAVAMTASSSGTNRTAINQAIGGATRKGSVEESDETFHTGGHINSFALSSGWTGVRELNWRSGFTGEQIAALDRPVTELSSNVTALADSADFRQGSMAARLEIAATAVMERSSLDDAIARRVCLAPLASVA